MQVSMTIADSCGVARSHLSPLDRA